MLNIVMPRIKHCNKWILISDVEIPKVVCNKHDLIRFGDISYFMYTFDCFGDKLENAYFFVSSVFAENDFDGSFFIFKPENKEFAY